jgi:hypothetical protein
MKKDLPEVEGNFEIAGDTIRSIAVVPQPQDPDSNWDKSDEQEDISQELKHLPVIDADDKLHHSKNSTYKSEVQTLLKSQGGSCPGQPLSPHVIQLLGKTADGKLVFPAMRNRMYAFPRTVPSVGIYKQWVSHIVEALQALHSIDVVQRDLTVENLLFTEDLQQVVVSDLECHWGRRRAPEILLNGPLDAGWTKESDIFDLGCVIQGLIYGNAPRTEHVEWPVPPPFDSIFSACKRAFPSERPTLQEIAAMLYAIDDSK